MSLKKYKNRREIIGEEIDHLELSPFNGSFYWWRSYYWYDEEDDDYWSYDYSPCDSCGQTYCDNYECQEYDYIKLPEFDWGYKIVNKAFRRWSITDPRLPGSYIDMETIYGKEEMRNRRIDIVLGLRQPSYEEKPTIGDIYKEKQKRNGN